MSRSDIIDDIDALIDEQLAAGESGHEQRARTADRRCWHCGRDWHGLAITKRLEEMRAEYRRRAAEAYERGEEAEYATSAILDGYRYDQDDSDILCPGSDFIGPMPATMRPFAGNPHTGCTCPLCRVMYGLGGGYSPGGVITCDSPGAVIPGDRSPSWLGSLPHNPWLIAAREPEPRWWRVDLTHVDRENVFMELEGPDLPTLTVRVGRGLSQYQAVMHLVRTTEDGTYAHRTFDDSGTPLTLDIHTPNIDDCDGHLLWHEITGPGGDYVHSREIVAASPHIDWFTTHNLTHLLPRRTRMRLALERFNVQMQAWQERLVEQFTEIGNTFRRATDRIEYSYREAFTNVADGMRVGVDVDGQVRTGIASNVEQRGDETTFDFTPDDAPPRLSLFGLDVFEDPALPADANSVAFDSTQFTRPTNRATRRRTPPRQDPYWVQRADRRRGRQ
ncbi:MULTISPECIES: hypothetical protein [Gordonia]|uniref:hypothetical protein n=1 Tax=Gordonia TaxID=2053 RepID=UPI00257AA9C1|nr:MULTISPECIES: hypothetical protein [Gordonia]